MGRRSLQGLCISIAAMALIAFAGACGGGLGPTEGPTPSPTVQATVSPPEGMALPPGVTFEAAGGKFAVHRMYVRVREFVAQARASPDVDRWDLFRPLIVEPMQEFFLYLGLTHPDWEQRWAEWVRGVDLAALEHTAALMEGAGVDGIAGKALDEVAAPLKPLGKRDVFLLPGQFPYNLFNFYGHVTAGGAVTIFLYAFPFEDPTASWRERLPGLVAHETHHSVRQSLGQFPLTVIGQMVTEGLADVFAEEMYGSPATIVQLDEETVRRLWPQVQRDALRSEREVTRPYIEGGEGVPPRTAYFFGYKIVQAYKASHPGETAASLVGASPFTIYEESGYEP